MQTQHKGWRLALYWLFYVAKFLVVISYVVFCCVTVTFAAIVYGLAAIRDRLFDGRCEWRDYGGNHD
ncbi:hypothetical protein MLDJOKPK_00253 [Salmonella phage SPAsTU]|nr:hypothetical protein STsAS_160 [Salmonella phage STsAS]AWN09151.1 hypothetical protein MLDJOKPK_00253 [Salmonella phage SPAsTU]